MLNLCKYNKNIEYIQIFLCQTAQNTLDFEAHWCTGMAHWCTGFLILKLTGAQVWLTGAHYLYLILYLLIFIYT